MAFELVDKIVHAAENKMRVLLILVNLSKAFDTINHDILLCKLKIMVSE